MLSINDSPTAPITITPRSIPLHPRSKKWTDEADVPDNTAMFSSSYLPESSSKHYLESSSDSDTSDDDFLDSDSGTVKERPLNKRKFSSSLSSKQQKLIAGM